MSKVVSRTHGGLGNQLFQVLYSRIFAQSVRANLYEVHDQNYPHRFPRSPVLAVSPSPSARCSVISSLRLPKLAGRYLKMKSGVVKVFGDYYLDGYFQLKGDYERFDEAVVSDNLRRVRQEIGALPKIDRRLLHLRVGDFFSSDAAAIDHVFERLNEAEPGLDLFTNDEDLFLDRRIDGLLKKKEIKVVSTKDLPAHELLKLMIAYKAIDANDSTLAFWASVLGGVSVPLKSASLCVCRDFFQETIAAGDSAYAQDLHQVVT